MPLIFVISQNVRPHHGGGGQGSLFESQITQSGLATPVLLLLWMSLFLLPLIATLVAGDIVANEDGNGTLKTILTRSVDRGQVFAGEGARGRDLRGRRRLSDRDRRGARGSRSLGLQEHH